MGNRTQQDKIRKTGRMNGRDQGIPRDTHVVKDREPVWILGTWLGNGIDQAMTWATLLESCHKCLKRWGMVKHSLEGRRLIIQMQVAGVTQYLTKVQGMPWAVEMEINKMIRNFMWNHEKVDTVNQAQMYAPHNKGGKKILDIEAHNKAIQLMWLKTYLNIGEDRATWVYFADAMIGTDILQSQNVDEDPESRMMPILQRWETRTRNSILPEDL